MLPKHNIIYINWKENVFDFCNKFRVAYNIETFFLHNLEHIFCTVRFQSMQQQSSCRCFIIGSHRKGLMYNYIMNYCWLSYCVERSIHERWLALPACHNTSTLAAVCCNSACLSQFVSLCMCACMLFCQSLCAMFHCLYIIKCRRRCVTLTGLYTIELHSSWLCGPGIVKRCDSK